mmetsp:Transcript_10795/g.66671  ORF Transcript_10795/g.66671 Transcript_10795/m.66671 type:complete len:131 (-) Transcript_10795:1252-1644(-)
MCSYLNFQPSCQYAEWAAAAFIDEEQHWPGRRWCAVHALSFVGKRCTFVRANIKNEIPHAMLKCDAVWMASTHSKCTRSATGFSSGWLRHGTGKEGVLADGMKCRLLESSHSVTSMGRLHDTSTACVLNC